MSLRVLELAATGVGNPAYWRMELEKYWPLFGLQISTPRLELRIPNDADRTGLRPTQGLG
jgi:hypothetical protein